MNNDQKYNHILELICGVDIIINSNICVCHSESNVSRFIKIAHKTPENVYDIISQNNNDNSFQITH